MATAITLTPGRATLADWRAVADGAAVRIDRTALPQVEAGARAVAAILAKGEPVYGINTGFGKLANVRIAAGDLADAAAQHRAVACRRRRRADAAGRSCG